jgi:DnaK suppressor protein
MEQYRQDMASQFMELLSEQEAQLRVLLQGQEPTLGLAQAPEPREVTDFKDVAEEESLALVQDAQATQAVHALEQVRAARRRLSDHSYGLCVDCGQPISLQRLLALPATPLCTRCQTERENQEARSQGH